MLRHFSPFYTTATIVDVVLAESLSVQYAVCSMQYLACWGMALFFVSAAEVAGSTSASTSASASASRGEK
jgi:hypothetical protein